MSKINISGIANKAGLDNFSGWESLDTLVDTKIVILINWLTGLSALVAVIFLIIAGYTYMTAMGDPDKIGGAQKTISGAIIGLVIIFIARLLVTVVVNLVVQGSLS